MFARRELKMSSFHAFTPDRLCDACYAHPRRDPSGATIFWSWRQRLIGPPAIEVALHTLRDDDVEAAETRSTDATRAVLHDVPFACVARTLDF